MAAIMKLMDKGAFDDLPCPDTGLPPAIVCPEDSGKPGATVCSQDECNLYGTTTPVGEEVVVADAISTCIQSGNYTQEQCETYGGDLTQLALHFGHGGIQPEDLETLYDPLEDLGQDLGDCAKIAACRGLQYANVLNYLPGGKTTEELVTEKCGRAC